MFNVMLGASLVHHYPPKHHPRALRILDDVLSGDEDNVPSLMGRAYILQASNDWDAAAGLFSRVNELLPDDVNEGIQAREELAWCSLHQGNEDAAAAELKAVSDILDDLEDREVDQARCLWRMGKCAWKAEGSNRPPLAPHPHIFLQSMTGRTNVLSPL
jgi:superkiller protein 3